MRVRTCDSKYAGGSANHFPVELWGAPRVVFFLAALRAKRFWLFLGG